MSLKNSATRWGRAEPPLTASRSRPAQRGMNLSEDYRAEVEARVRIEPAIQVAQVVESGVKEGTAPFNFIDDTPMDRLPHCRHSDKRGRANVGERPR